MTALPHCHDARGQPFPPDDRQAAGNDHLGIAIRAQGDEAARAAGYPRGKEECWLVLDADPDARLAIGFTRAVTPEEIAAAAQDGSIEALLEWHPARPGDLFYLPAGTVHAIGPGLALVEVQRFADSGVNVVEPVGGLIGGLIISVMGAITSVRGAELVDRRLAGARPVLGICVGMQMLLDHSAEGHTAAGTPGLGLIAGEVLKFDCAGQTAPDGSRYKVPQMGWNRVHQSRPHPVWGSVADGEWFYFVHSFYARPLDAGHSVGETEYGARFTSAVARDNIFATQFHPEKSANQGLALYRNFLHWEP